MKRFQAWAQCCAWAGLFEKTKAFFPSVAVTYRHCNLALVEKAGCGTSPSRLLKIKVFLVLVPGDCSARSSESVPALAEPRCPRTPQNCPYLAERKNLSLFLSPVPSLSCNVVLYEQWLILTASRMPFHWDEKLDPDLFSLSFQMKPEELFWESSALCTLPKQIWKDSFLSATDPARYTGSLVNEREGHLQPLCRGMGFS